MLFANVEKCCTGIDFLSLVEKLFTCTAVIGTKRAKLMNEIRLAPVQ